MRRKLSTLLAGVVAAGAALFAVHPAVAAVVPVPAGLSPATLTTFYDGGYVGFMALTNISDDCDYSGYGSHWGSFNQQWWNLSSIRYNRGTSGQTYCNAIFIHNHSGNQAWYGECLSSADSGIYVFREFYAGSYFNDNVDGWQLKRWDGCALYR